MIKPKTVLILGAGASQPYGFPLGNELRKNILAFLLSHGSQEYRLLRARGYNDDYMNAFRRDLNDAQHETIDDFLTDRPTYRTIGNDAIATALMSCENHEFMFSSRDWYPKLFDVIGFKNETSLISGIITLNYDRSVEHFLSHTIGARYEGETKKNAYNKLSSLPILHLHGVLGEYHQRPYKKVETTDDIDLAVANLRITSDDDLDNSQNYIIARKLCNDASMLMFLGFGYHTRIMDRLGLLGRSVPQIIGSGYGINSRARDLLKDKYPAIIQLGNEHEQLNSYFNRVLLSDS